MERPIERHRTEGPSSTDPHGGIEQTGGEISVGDLAEEVGYASKSSAHNVKEKWRADRGLASDG